MRLVVDSGRRDTGLSASSANFIINFPRALTRIKEVTLEQVLLPNAIYRVRSSVNDRVDFNDGAVKVATLTPGVYNATTLMQELSSQLNSVGANFTCTYSSATMKVTISNTGAFTLLFGSGANISRSAARLLGFNASDTSNATSQTGANILQLNNPMMLYMVIPELGVGGYTSGFQNYTFAIPMTVNNEDLMVFDSASYYAQSIHFPESRSIDKLTVRLFIERPGNNAANSNAGVEVVDLNGADWSFLLKLDQE